MHAHDDSLEQFEAHGAAALPPEIVRAYIDHCGARIWYATHGEGPAVILLHGGLGHSGNWGYQIPALVGAGYRVVLIDSRGHGHSTRDSRPYSYELMASDVLAVMDILKLEKVALVGWSDGACIALIVGMQAPERVAGGFSSAAIWTRAARRSSCPRRSLNAASVATLKITHNCPARLMISTPSLTPSAK